MLSDQFTRTGIAVTKDSEGRVELPDVRGLISAGNVLGLGSIALVAGGRRLFEEEAEDRVAICRSRRSVSSHTPERQKIRVHLGEREVAPAPDRRARRRARTRAQRRELAPFIERGQRPLFVDAPADRRTAPRSPRAPRRAGAAARGQRRRRDRRADRPARDRAPRGLEQRLLDVLAEGGERERRALAPISSARFDNISARVPSSNAASNAADPSRPRASASSSTGAQRALRRRGERRRPPGLPARSPRRHRRREARPSGTLSARSTIANVQRRCGASSQRHRRA